MTSGQRILLNALATYGRTIFSMLLGLFSSRWILSSLGAVDYGLMSVVGSLIVFVTFLNGISGTACARFFALSIGAGDKDETNWWFNTALSTHVILPSLLIAIGCPIGEWAIDGFLSIPADRLATAHWVFRLSLFSAFFNMSCTPYLSMYTAKQNIVELSFWSMGLTICNFIFAWWLTTYQGNSWLLYSAITVLISVLFAVAQAVRAQYLFSECSISVARWYNKKRIISMFSYAGWTMLGGLGWMMYNQGMAIVLNKYFPPTRFKSVNASYTVGSALAGYTQTLSNALMNAFLPEIVSSEGRGDRGAVIKQVFRASRLSFFIIAILAIPLCFETGYVLQIWLKNPPEFSVIFCRTFLISFLLSRLVGGFDAAICATGKIRSYQVTMSIFSISSVFVAAAVVLTGWGIEGICGVILTFNLINVAGSIFFCHKLVGISIRDWFSEVLIPSLYVVALGGAVGLLSKYCLIEIQPFVNFLLDCFIIGIVVLIASIVFLIKPGERDQMRMMISKIKNKIRV